MGLRARYIDYIDRFIKEEFDGFKGIKMLELGNQEIKSSRHKKYRTGKELYDSRGVEHVSIDMNGLDGSHRIDLSKPIFHQTNTSFDEILNLGIKFDVITNSGTSEHVEPFESQYECFENIHYLCAPGGIMIHIIPDAVEWEARGAFEKKHCNNYYTKEFFEILAENNGYYMLSMRVVRALRYVCLKKINNKSFMKDRELFLSNIVRQEGAKGFCFD